MTVNQKKMNLALVVASIIIMGSDIVTAQDINAVTADGNTVLLHDDGTWSVLDTTPSDEEGKVNLALANVSNIGSSCRVRLQYENMTNIFFDDFAPGILMMDKDGFAVGEGCGVGMENLRPNGIATCTVSARNVPCGDIATVAVSGWQYCYVEGQRDTTGRICDPYLNVLPSSQAIQLIQR